MEYRALGRGGPRVSVVGLGCSNFGRQADMNATAEIVAQALDRGVTLFDTADVYGARGLSEEYLGKALGARRKDVLVATKFGKGMGIDPRRRDASAGYVVSAAEASLKRLGTDFIDLYQLHVPVAETPIGETLEALERLVHQGKIRYYGASNFTAQQIEDAHKAARSRDYAAFISVQCQYSLVERDAEREVIPACQARGIGFLAYSPLAGGILTGKYRLGAAPPPDSRLATTPAILEPLLSDRVFAFVAQLEVLAGARGRSMLELALGWALSRNGVSSVLVGAKHPQQVLANVAAAECKLTPDELASLASFAS